MLHFESKAERHYHDVFWIQRCTTPSCFILNPKLNDTIMIHFESKAEWKYHGSFWIQSCTRPSCFISKSALPLRGRINAQASFFSTFCAGFLIMIFFAGFFVAGFFSSPSVQASFLRFLWRRLIHPLQRPLMMCFLARGFLPVCFHPGLLHLWKMSSSPPPLAAHVFLQQLSQTTALLSIANEIAKPRRIILWHWPHLTVAFLETIHALYQGHSDGFCICFVNSHGFVNCVASIGSIGSFDLPGYNRKPIQQIFETLVTANRNAQLTDNWQHNDMIRWDLTSVAACFSSS